MSNVSRVQIQDRGSSGPGRMCRRVVYNVKRQVKIQDEHTDREVGDVIYRGQKIKVYRLVTGDIWYG